MSKSKRMPIEETKTMPTVDAAEALRKNLLYTMLNTVTADDMTEIVRGQVELAKEKSPKSARLIMDMVISAKPSERPVQSVVVNEGCRVNAIVDARKIIVCLIAFDGPKTTEEVAQRLNLDGEAAILALRCEMFDRTDGKWVLTNAARSNFLETPAKILASQTDSD